jgi:hypothetical protein
MATTRRKFIQMTSAATAAAVLAAAWPAKRALGANERLGVGYIGAGGRAGAHMSCIKYLRDDQKAAVDPVAVCDIYRPRMERAAKALGAKGYMDYKELLADPKVDVVCIATPDHLHGYQAIDALKAGKSVYCEKPVTHWRQFDLIKRLAEEVKKSGKAFQCGSQGMSDGARQRDRAGAQRRLEEAGREVPDRARREPGRSLEEPARQRPRGQAGHVGRGGPDVPRPDGPHHGRLGAEAGEGGEVRRREATDRDVIENCGL